MFNIRLILDTDFDGFELTSSYPPELTADQFKLYFLLSSHCSYTITFNDEVLMLVDITDGILSALIHNRIKTVPTRRLITFIKANLPSGVIIQSEDNLNAVKFLKVCGLRKLTESLWRS